MAAAGGGEGRGDRRTESRGNGMGVYNRGGKQGLHDGFREVIGGLEAFEEDPEGRGHENW